MPGISARFSNFTFVLFCYITNHLMTGPLGNSEFCFPRISMFPSTSSRETLRFPGNKIHCSPRHQSLIKCLLLLLLLLKTSLKATEDMIFFHLLHVRSLNEKHEILEKWKQGFFPPCPIFARSTSPSVEDNPLSPCSGRNTTLIKLKTTRPGILSAFLLQNQ